MSKAPDLDAVFCGSDQIARGAADGLRELGRKIPQDIALVGFDNWATMAEASSPPLTTVDMNLTRVGEISAEVLLAAIDGRASPGTTLVPCQLVVRDSTRA
jgi:LacI family transcriptional regulator